MSDQQATHTAVEVTAKDSALFLAILMSLENKPDVNWEMVAAKTGYKNATVASTRYGQIMKRLTGLTGAQAMSGGASAMANTPTSTPKKARITGSGTNRTPAKVKKTRGPRGSTKKAIAESKIKAEDDDENDEDEDEQTEMGPESHPYNRAEMFSMYNCGPATSTRGSHGPKETIVTHVTYDADRITSSGPCVGGLFNDESMQDDINEEVRSENQTYGYPYIG